MRFENLAELADAHRQNSSGRSCSGDHYRCTRDACWAHVVPPVWHFARLFLSDDPTPRATRAFKGALGRGLSFGYSLVFRTHKINVRLKIEGVGVTNVAGFRWIR